MKRNEFERLVEQGFLAIPASLRQKISNVIIFIEDEPSAKVRKATKLSTHQTLFGLYEGIPNTNRMHYGVGMTLPDRITIFQKPVEQEAKGDKDKVRIIVRDTIWHEIAHYFGMNESEIRAYEARRGRAESVRDF